MWPDGLKPPTVLPSAAVSALLACVWLQPWAPGPLTNTVPLLLSWAVPAVLLALGQLPTALECARAWAWAAVLSSLMGLLQYFGDAAVLGGWVHVPAYLGDALGNLRQRNQLATHLALGMASVLWWQCQGLHRRQALWMLALMASAMAATGSRTGLLQLLMLPPLLWLWSRTRTSGQTLAPDWRLGLWAVALYMLASAVLPALLDWRTGQSVDTALTRMGEAGNCGSRRVLWTNVLHLIGQKPWTGWGWGELKYAHYMAQYPGERFCDILGNAHNLPLQLAVELGVPMAAGISLVLLAALWRAHPWRLQGQNDALAWGVLAPIALHSLLEYPLWYGPFQVATLAALVLLRSGTARILARHRRALQVLAMGGMGLLALMAWDYQRVRQIYLPPAQRSVWWHADPWGAARQTWFFGGALRFAEVTVTPLTPDNAQTLFEASLRALHDSPEPRVIDKLTDSARLLGRNDLADWHQTQKQKAYGQAAP